MNEQNNPAAVADEMANVTPLKRKKGRPLKNRGLEEDGNSPALNGVDGKPRRTAKKQHREMVSTSAPLDGSFVGQQVHGVLDGSFDAGYLLTVRVGNTQTVLRGAVFEPTLSAPICEANDIAPSTKFIEREENPTASYSVEPTCIPRSGVDKHPSSSSSLPLEEAQRPSGTSSSSSIPKDVESNCPNGGSSRDVVMAV